MFKGLNVQKGIKKEIYKLLYRILNMKKTTLLVAAVLPVFMAGCTNTTNTTTDTPKAIATVTTTVAPAVTKVMTPVATTSAAETAAHAAIKKATADNKAVKAVGFEWNVTKKLLKKAGAAVKKGEFAKATKLAKKASRYTVYGFEQAETSKTAGPRL